MKKGRTKTKSVGALPKWQTKWPRDGDLASWFRCGIEKCQAIRDIETGSQEAHCPIGALAELGHTHEALKHVKAFLKRLPRTARYSVDIVRMAELGAEICLMTDDLTGCDKFLAIAAKCDELVTRKCDLNWASQSVRQFRIDHGLVDPAEADSDELLDATFNYSQRQFKAALARRDRKAATKFFDDMSRCILDPKLKGWRKSIWVSRMIPLASSLGSQKPVTRLIEALPASQRKELGYALLGEAGFKKEAVAVAVAELKENLRELKTMEDPNVHFPVMAIERALTFLMEHGEKELARQWFGKVARSAKSWKCVIQGWVTSAVLTTFVPIVKELEGEAAARELAQLSLQHAKGDSNNAFKQGAIDEAISAVASAGAADEAIAAARKLRSPTERRKQLAKLFAQAGRWKELREVCQQATSPEEAADIAWWTKFELPGGAVE